MLVVATSRSDSSASRASYVVIPEIPPWPFVDLLRCSIAISVNGIRLLVFTANSPLVKLCHISGSDIFMASMRAMNSGMFEFNLAWHMQIRTCKDAQVMPSRGASYLPE